MLPNSGFGADAKDARLTLNRWADADDSKLYYGMFAQLEIPFVFL